MQKDSEERKKLPTRVIVWKFKKNTLIQLTVILTRGLNFDEELYL